MTRPLEGRTVLVTGGGVRLGRAIAEGVGRLGASVAVHYSGSKSGADDAVRSIARDGNRAQAFQADLTREEAIGPLVSAVEAALGPIDALVNSAAIFERRPLLETTSELLDRQWAINARGPYLLLREVARGMLARGGGQVVNVLDLAGAFHAWRDYSAYCMTKAAMASLTECLALELAPAIRVNGVAPGTVLPPEAMTAEERVKQAERIPQKRLGTAEDVVAAVGFFLTGPSFITGQILAVDGGRSLGSGWISAP